MKTTYISPKIEVIEISMTMQMLAGSVSIDLADDIVDPGGAQAPGADMSGVPDMPGAGFPFLK